MGTSIRFGKLWGIPIGVNYSWFIILFIFTIALSSQFSRQYSWAAPVQWSVAMSVSLLFFGSVLVHELAHSLLALRKGIPVKGITLFIFGGVSQISREASRPSTEFLIAAVGPISSLVLGAIFLGLAWASHPFSQQLWAAASILAYGNFALGIFNLIPGFPLDGGRVFRAIVWGISHNYNLATRVATIGGQIVGFGLMLLGFALVIGLFPGIDRSFIQGLWLVFIGWFLSSAASSTYKQHRLRSTLEGYRARDLMSMDCPSLSPDMTLRELVEDTRLLQDNSCFLVGDSPRMQGLLTLAHLKATPSSRRGTTTIGRVMTPISELKSVEPEDDAYQVLEQMEEADTQHVAVLERGELVGLISRESLTLFMRRRQELGL